MLKDYTKGRYWSRRRWNVALTVALAAWLWTTPLPAQTAPAQEGHSPMAVAGPADFTGWHLPLPAGDWQISRGPCGSGGLFTHQCGYYEDSCALDIQPVSGSMFSVPVLAPQAGQVFFLGTRLDSGLTILLQHADGRVSALMHLSKVVVAPDQRVAQGQVVAYAGSSGSSSRPHLHFHVQPNTVDRECLPLPGLDEIDLRAFTAKSFNLPWASLALIDPPPELPLWLPLLAPPGPAAPALLPGRVLLAPGAQISLPVAVAASALPAGRGVYFAGQVLSPTLQAAAYNVFAVPLLASQTAGEYAVQLQVRPSAAQTATATIRIRYAVRVPPTTSSSTNIVLINPTFVRPANWTEVSEVPELCWSEPTSAGLAPLLFRVMVAGPQLADSGWISARCWQPPALTSGDYTWKVFVRDAQGYMNRTNQRPYVFRLR